MPMIPATPCAFPGCPELRPCPAHSRHGDRGSAASRGYDAAWKRLRRIILARDPLCKECVKRGVYEQSTDVDHIVRIADAPHRRLDLTNLQGLCHRCHSKKTAAGA